MFPTSVVSIALLRWIGFDIHGLSCCYNRKISDSLCCELHLHTFVAFWDGEVFHSIPLAAVPCRKKGHASRSTETVLVKGATIGQ